LQRRKEGGKLTKEDLIHLVEILWTLHDELFLGQ
jgi:hypothetical protein